MDKRNSSDKFDQISNLNKAMKNTKKMVNSISSGFKDIAKQIREIAEDSSDYQTEFEKDWKKLNKSKKGQEKKDRKESEKQRKKEERNRRNTNKDILRSARNLNRDIQGEMDRFNDSFEDSMNNMVDQADDATSRVRSTFDNLYDTVRDLAIVDGLNDISRGIEDNVDSYVDLTREMKKHVEWSNDQWKEYSNTVSQAVKDANYQLSRSEMNEIGSKLVMELGIDDNAEISTYMSDLAKIQSVVGSDINDLADIIKIDRTSGSNGEILRMMSDIAVSLDNNGMSTKQEDILSSLNQVSDSFNQFARGDTDLYKKMMTEFAQVRAASDDSYYSFAGDMLQKISEATYQDISDLAQAGLLQAGNIQKLMKQGDVAEAGRLLANELADSLQNSSMQEYLKSTGLADMNQISEAITNGSAEAFEQSLTNAMKYTSDGLVGVDDKIAQTINGPFEKMKNWFFNLKPITKIQDMFAELNVGMANIFFAMSVAKMAKDTVNGIKELGSLNDIKDNISNLTGNNSILENLNNTFDDRMLDLLGSEEKQLAYIDKWGTGISGKLQTLGSMFKTGMTTGLTKVGSFLSGGSLAGGSALAAGAAGVAGIAAGVAGLFSSVKDLVKATKTKDKKQKQDLLFSSGSKAGLVGLGTAIGTAIAPGIGTAIGAGIGGIAAIISGSKLGKFLSNIWSSDALRPIRDGLSAVASGFKSIVHAVIDPIKEAFSQAKNAIGQVAGVFKQVGSFLLKGIFLPFKIQFKIIGGLLKLTSKVLTTLVKVALQPIIIPIKLVGKAFELLGKGITAVKDFFARIKEKVKTTFQPFLNTIKEIKNTLSSIFGKSENGGNGLLSIFSGLAKIIGKVITPVFKVLGKIVEVAIVTPFKILAGLLNIIIKPFKWIVDGVKAVADFFKNTFGKVVEGINNLVETISAAINKLKGNKADGSNNDIVSGAKDAWSDLKKGKIFSAVGDIWSGVVGSVKSFFGINKKKDDVDGSHANGLDTVPRDGYLAELHKNESVLTSKEAPIWRSLKSGGLLTNLVKAVKELATSKLAKFSPMTQLITKAKEMTSHPAINYDPKDKGGPNPNGNPPPVPMTRTAINPSSNNSDPDFDNSDVVAAIKWLANRLERKLDEVSVDDSTTNNIMGNTPGYDRKSDEVFSF